MQCLRDNKVWLQFSLTQCFCAVTYNSDYCIIDGNITALFSNQLLQQMFQTVFFYFCVSMHHSISQIKHQLDATLCRFYFCRVTLHTLTQYPPEHAFSFVPNMVMWRPTCNYNTCTRGCCASFLMFQTVFHNMSTCFTIGISLLLLHTFKHFLHFQHCIDQCWTLSAHSRQNGWKGGSYVLSMCFVDFAWLHIGIIA